MTSPADTNTEPAETQEASERPDAAPQASLDEQVRAIDPDRWLASRFANAKERKRLVALYAFNHEIARVREIVSDPMVGEIRLAWWREVIDELFEKRGVVRRHEVALALAEAFANAHARPKRELFEAMIDARVRELHEERFTTLNDLTSHAEATAGGLIRLTAASLSGGTLHKDAQPLCRAAGRAWGLIGALRAFAHNAAQGRLILPLDVVNAAGATPQELLTSPAPELASRAAEPVLEAARAAAAKAARHAEDAPPALWPALGYCALIPAYIRSLEQTGLYQQRPISLLRRQTRLFWSSMKGTI